MSRSTVISEVSRSVTGTFALHDLVSIVTVSGSINVTIVPQPASSSKAPAELRLNTTSGSIRVTMAPSLHNPSLEIPERIFNSSLKSMSGSIHAALVHNYRTSLHTMSGNITASLHPLGQPSSMSYVDVRCLSGLTSMTVHPYVNSPQASLRTLSTDFRGGSGWLKIRFPSTWEGEVTSHLSNGRVRYEWEGLRVLTDGPSFTAIKGNGLGKLNIWGNSMNVDLVGDRMPDLPRAVVVKEEGERVSGSSMEVGLKGEGEHASGSPTETEVKEEGEHVPVVPGMPGLPREVEVQEEGERVPVVPGIPALRREVEVQEEGERTPALPKEDEWQEEEVDDDDGWTIVGNEDGAQEVTKRPPPTYEDAMRT